MSNDPVADAALKEAESIVNAEADMLHSVHAQVEAKVEELEAIACITHEEAHKAYAMFYRSMAESAKANGVDLTTFMSKQSDDRTKLWMGMIIGSLPLNQVSIFKFRDGYFD
jgi:hypothetical protein